MDLADKAGECCGALPLGAFADGNGRGRAALPACECGGRPVYVPHPPLRKGGPQLETLACSACGNSVGPYQARHQLATAWKLGGYRRDK